MPSKKDAAVIRAIGIDTGKNTLHMVGLDEKGAIVLREKVSRNRITARLVNMPPCLIGIEAGMATHYMSRELVALGHKVKQVPPAYARPFRQGHKNDFRDAQAVAEAVHPWPHHKAWKSLSANALCTRRPRYSAPPGELGEAQLRTLAHVCGAAPPSQCSGNRARQ